MPDIHPQDYEQGPEISRAQIRPQGLRAALYHLGRKIQRDPRCEDPLCNVARIILLEYSTGKPNLGYIRGLINSALAKPC